MKYSILLSLGIICIALSSCNNKEYFELEYPPEYPWRNVTEFDRALSYPYSMVFSNGWGGGLFLSNAVVSEASTDVIRHIAGGVANWPVTECYNRSVDSKNTNLDETYQAAYNAINNINFALDFEKNRTNYFAKGEHPFDNITSTQQQLLNRQLGELHLLRAYSYFQLSLFYLGKPGTTGFASSDAKYKIPYRAEWNIDPAVQANSTYENAKTIYENIILPDLYKALTLLAPTVKHPYIGHANIYGAKALAARIYFVYSAEDNTYLDKILGLLNDVSDSDGKWGSYELEINPLDAFNKSSLIESKESIWTNLNYDPVKGYVPRDPTLFAYNKYQATNTDTIYDFTKTNTIFVSSNRCTWHTYCMSRTIAKKIGWLQDPVGDPIETSNTDSAKIDKRYLQLYLRVNPVNPLDDNRDIVGLYETSFPGENLPNIWSWKYFRGEKGSESNVPFIRLAEVILMKSAVYYLKKDNANALKYMNITRRRAGLANLVAFDINEFDKEWIKELSFEGLRLPYLIAMQSEFGDKIPDGDTDRGRSGSGFSLNDYIWRLPQDEIDFQR